MFHRQGQPEGRDSLEDAVLADCKLLWMDIKDLSLEDRKYLRDFCDLYPLTAKTPTKCIGFTDRHM